MTGTAVMALAASTWFLTGLVWIVQVVHYPLFAAVGADRFAAYEDVHTRRTAAVERARDRRRGPRRAVVGRVRPPVPDVGLVRPAGTARRRVGGFVSRWRRRVA